MTCSFSSRSFVNGPSMCSTSWLHLDGEPHGDSTTNRDEEMFGSSLLNNLIRPQQQRRRDRQAKRLGRLEIDHQLVLRRLLDWKIGRLGALQDLINVSRRLTGEVRNIRPITHEPPGLYSLPENIHSR